MQKVKVTGAIYRIGTGTVIGMSPKQAMRRRHVIEPLPEKDMFRAKAPLQFKSGEEIVVSVEGLSREQQSALGIERLVQTADGVTETKVEPLPVVRKTAGARRK